jgi:hypothetical protein
MASKEVEVLDPAPTVEKLEKSAPERVLNRRHFIAALGVAGAAVAGTELVRSGPTALAQQPKPNGYAQVDVLNFLLNLKYLKASFYSFLTTTGDLSPTSFANLGSGGVFQPPKQITTWAAAGSATALEVQDLFNAMYYDEISDLVTLRSIIGAAVQPRATMNLLGTGATTATGSQTVTQVQAISILRMLEDLSASAFAGATIYLTGTNLQYATQALAVNGFHAGALRLLALQAGAPYYSPQDLTTLSATSQSQNSFTGSLVAGSTTVYNFAPTNPITVGSILTGPSIPPNTTITSVTPPTVYTGSLSGTTAAPNNIVSNVSPAPSPGLQTGMALAGTGIPANSIITAINGTTITLGTLTGYATTGGVLQAPPAPITNGLLGVTGTGGIGLTLGNFPLTIDPPPAPGAQAAGNITVLTTGTTAASGTYNIVLTASGSGYITPPNIKAATGGTGLLLTPTMPGQITTTTASVTLTPGFLAATTKGNNVLTLVSPNAGVVPAQLLSGSNIPSNSFIAQGGVSAAAGTITVVQQSGTNSNASATTSVAPTGLVTAGTSVITGVSSVSGILFGMPISGTGIPANATVSTFDPVGLTITMSTTASTTTTGTTSVNPTCFLTAGSNVITDLSSLSGLSPGAKVTGINIPANTVIGSVGGVNTATLAVGGTTPPFSKAAFPSATTAFTAGPSLNAILQSGNNIVSYVTINPVPVPYTTSWPSALANGLLISDSQGNIPPNTTITAVTAANNTITLSAPATGATAITPVLNFTGTVVVSYQTISSVAPPSAFTATPTGSTIPYLSPGAPIVGPNIPAGTVVSGVSPSASTVTISTFPSAAGGPEIVGASLSILPTTTLITQVLGKIRVDTAVSSQSVTVTTVETVTPSLGTATLSQAATATGTNTLIVEGTDNMDVEPYDFGTAALSSAGPAPVPGTSPAVYGGFFDTASGSTSSATNPAGSTFARTFSQVLTVLYGSTAPQTYEGGFFPNGVSGTINFV